MRGRATGDISALLALRWPPATVQKRLPEAAEHLLS